MNEPPALLATPAAVLVDFLVRRMGEAAEAARGRADGLAGLAPVEWVSDEALLLRDDGDDAGPLLVRGVASACWPADVRSALAPLTEPLSDDVDDAGELPRLGSC